MAKKSFKGENPALRYISMQNTEDAQDTQNTESVQKTDNTQYAYNKQNEGIMLNTQHTDNLYNADKLASLSKETKSKRLNVLIRPSAFEDASKVAHMQRISVNELIHLAVERYVRESEGEIKRYDALYGGKRE